MNEENKSIGKHSVRIENREKIVLTGVTDVPAFNENEICAETSLGQLTIKGEGLHINKLNLDSGDLFIDGQINSVSYTEIKEPKTSKSSLFGKMFG